MLASPDPTDTFAMEFPEDSAKPETARRRIVCRQLTCRQLLALQRAYEAAWQSKDDPGLIAALADALMLGAIRLEGGWQSPGEATADRLIDNLGLADLDDCLKRYSTDALISGLDRKKSARQSQSSLAAPAAAAAG